MSDKDEEGVEAMPMNEIVTRRGRLLLNAGAYLRHPFSREKRAEFEFSQGWNDPEFDAA